MLAKEENRLGGRKVDKLKEVMTLRRVSVAVLIGGFFLLVIGASASDNGAPDELWVLSAIAGTVLLIAGTMLWQYAIYLRQERSKRRRRYTKKKSA